MDPLQENGGSLHVDDEGTPTQKNVLIENGILKSYMVDKLDGLRAGLKPTGSARRQDYRHYPVARMTNTYIDTGKKYTGRNHYFDRKRTLCKINQRRVSGSGNRRF